VWGDRIKGLATSKFNSCLPGIEEKKILEAPKLSALFARDVNLNVGFDYLKTLASIGFDLKKREVYLSRRAKK
jgi:hypothetical protein